MAAPWKLKGPIYEYSFYECETGLATQWGPWGHTNTSGHDGPVAKLHEHLCAAFGAERISQITWHKDPAPGSRLKPKPKPELELESDPEDYFEPSRDCRRRTHPLDELYPNPANVPLKNWQRHRLPPCRQRSDNYFELRPESTGAFAAGQLGRRSRIVH